MTKPEFLQTLPDDTLRGLDEARPGMMVPYPPRLDIRPVTDACTDTAAIRAEMQRRGLVPRER